jgi:molybdopterin-synthase adenylyltransferase
MSRLVLSEYTFQQVYQSLFRDENESCVILFGRAIKVDDNLARIVIRESIIPEERDYDYRTPYGVQLSSVFIAKITQQVRQNGDSIIFVHSHPGDMDEFSRTDDLGERVLNDFFSHRTPGRTHASIVFTRNSFRARILGTNIALSVTACGTELRTRVPVFEQTVNMYDRQIRAFGKEAQSNLSSLTIAIVGTGGTGSVIAQQLAHLGVRRFILMDPDILDVTNLNRMVGSTPQDIGKPKVEVIKRLIESINIGPEVVTLMESVLNNRSALKLVTADFIFCCTDSHGSRAILNQLAYQYIIPTIDMGVVIKSQSRKIEYIAARTQLLSPGIACLVCENLLDYEEVRRDLLSEFERRQDPYIPSENEPAPAVISLNSTIASMAVTMFLNAVVGIPGTARHINYNALLGTTRPVLCAPHPNCIVCSRSGAFANGDKWQMPGRIE